MKSRLAVDREDDNSWVTLSTLILWPAFKQATLRPKSANKSSERGRAWHCPMKQSPTSMLEWRAGELTEYQTCQLPVKLTLIDCRRADSRSIGICRYPTPNQANGAIVAARSVVVSDVPAFSVVGGNPARVIRQRFPDDVVNELLAIQWWNWPLDRITRNLAAIVGADVTALKNAE